MAVPAKVLKIKGKKAQIKQGNEERLINISMIKNLRRGDWVLAHADIGINKIPSKEANKILTLVKECDHGK
jgi:hydrogenase assembly chaperone HypC/HupF